MKEELIERKIEARYEVKFCYEGKETRKNSEGALELQYI